MKPKIIIDVASVPSDMTIERYIRTHTDILAHIENLKPAQHRDYISLKLDLDISPLQENVKSLMKKYGVFAFHYAQRKDSFESYLSTSLTHNPHAIDNISSNPHQSGIGSSLYSSGNSEDYVKAEALKNTYADTYSFNHLNPIARESDFGLLLSSFKRSLIRSRLSMIEGNRQESTSLNYLWHQDESIFLNLRINIPIISNKNYLIQILKDDNNEAEFCEFSLEPGLAYVYNTQKYHRPYCKNLNQDDRINLICGVSPWFDYDREKNIWVSNEFYGEVHPFDMFEQGLISSVIHK
jgi:hypothetical protein